MNEVWREEQREPNNKSVDPTGCPNEQGEKAEADDVNALLDDEGHVDAQGDQRVEQQLVSLKAGWKRRPGESNVSIRIRKGARKL